MQKYFELNDFNFQPSGKHKLKRRSEQFLAGRIPGEVTGSSASKRSGKFVTRKSTWKPNSFLSGTFQKYAV